MQRIISPSPQKTRKVAGEFAQAIIQKEPEKSAVVVGLYGELGSGKTSFVQGFVRGLGIKKAVTSPTFVIARRYNLPQKTTPRFSYIIHIDAYRLRQGKVDNARDLKNLNMAQWIKDPRTILLVEWPENIRSMLPRSALRISFEHGKNENERIIHLPNL